MAVLDAQQFFLRLGPHDSGTSRTGSAAAPDDTSFWVPIAAGGLAITGGRETVDVETEHEDKGIKYSIPGARNSATSSMSTPLFPSRAGLLLDLATSYEATGLPTYHILDQYWQDDVLGGVTAAPNSELGRRLIGCLWDGFSLSINRDQIGPVLLETTFYANQNVQLTGTATPVVASTGPTGFQSWPVEGPYTTGNIFVDFVDSSGNFTGNNTSVQQVTLQFGNAIEVKGFSASSTASLNNTWTQANTGRQTLTGSVVLYFDNPDYENYARGADIARFKMRIMGFGADPSGSTVTTGSYNPTSATSIAVSDETGFAENDWILVDDGVDQVVVMIDDTPTTGALPVAVRSGMPTALGSGATVKNTAWEILVPLMDLTGEPQIGRDGVSTTVTLNFAGRVTVGSTSLVTVSAYNDNGA